MQIKIFTMPYSGAIGGFDDEGLRQFLTDKEVLAVQPQFFVKDGVPHWTVLVQYNLVEGAQEGSKTRERKTSEDWRSQLKKEDWGLFNRLREWRNETAKEQGVPPYLIFTNKQLTEIVTTRPKSLTALGRIAGIGPSRVEKYGKPVLDLLDGAGREPDTKQGTGTESAGRVDRVSRVADAHDREVSETDEVHSDESDRQSGAGHGGKTDRGAVHTKPKETDS